MLNRFIDVTSLTGNETITDIKELCELARHKNVAAVCVYPKWVEYVSNELWVEPIGIATVLNFPEGNDRTSKVIKEAIKLLDMGATEFDIVVPYKKSYADIKQFVQEIVSEFPTTLNKFIIETSELDKFKLIENIRACCAGGADFVKTSTGKKGPATDIAVKYISEALRDHFIDTDTKIGLKVSGGIKTLRQAMDYYFIMNTYLRQSWDSLFRIGAGVEGSKAILAECDYATV
jgi:deoxyribose-phosphate aldolase